VSEGIWAELVGQEKLIAVLRRAVGGAAHAMTHAWLFVGPPGSGRSNAARAFAAALQCPDGGCGACNTCSTVLNGSHPDITLVRTEQLSIGVKELRELVLHAMISPAVGPYQIIVIEDADRITERGADALLKSLEEPAPRTVWLLCAPNPDEVIATIRSRCRLAELVTPSAAAISQLLQRRDGVDPQTAEFAARVSQGHIGRARALATDSQAQARRAEVLGLPARLTSLGSCLQAAAELIAAANAEAAGITAELDAAELAELSAVLGLTTGRAKPRSAAAALKELEEQQKKRSTRLQRDCLDRVLTEFTSYYRDVLAQQLDAGTPAINAEQSSAIAKLARSTTPEATLRKLQAILGCRRALMTNVAPLAAVESLLLSLVA
jgi:DNA polymerase-3 subunit delta'